MIHSYPNIVVQFRHPSQKPGYALDLQFLSPWHPETTYSSAYLLSLVGTAVCAHTKLLQKCPTLCDLMDCSPPGSSVHGILQARILEWVAMPSSRGSS